MLPGDKSFGSIDDALCRLFDFIEDLQFWIKDANGRYVRVNRGFLLNYSLDHSAQVLGKTDEDLSPAHLADQYRQDDARVLRGEAILGRVEMVGRFDHTAAWSLTHKVPVRRGKKIIGSAGITRPLSQKLVPLSFPDPQDRVMSHVVAAIRNDFARAWTNAELAKSARMSERAFERRFRVLYGDTPQVYIRRLRARMASRALVYSSRTLAKIAAESGYADQSHFTREFRRFIAMTPLEYRRRYGSV